MTRRVLICEDETIVALDLQLLVEDMGLEVIGPFRARRAAQAALGRIRPDAAILDVHLQDGDVFPLARILAEAGIPVLFHSGHAEAREVLSRFPGARLLTKPICADDLAGSLREALSDGP